MDSHEGAGATLASAPAAVAASSNGQTTAGREPAAALTPRKFKASDLPLPSATRAAIESLAHSFKKEGAYDSIRKQVWENFEASVWITALFVASVR